MRPLECGRVLAGAVAQRIEASMAAPTGPVM